jgi:RimJ/RimL family protein N-acetyltransferase
MKMRLMLYRASGRFRATPLSVVTSFSKCFLRATAALRTDLMSQRTPPLLNTSLRLRDVEASDIPIFFEHQCDPDATHMAAFPARSWNDFTAHWTKILADKTVITQTILFNDQVAGTIVSFEQGGQREVGYWLGKPFWGHGLATQALILFLEHVQIRPLYAYVAKHNIASRRVLEKCGFVIRSQETEAFILELPADKQA